MTLYSKIHIKKIAVLVLSRRGFYTGIDIDRDRDRDRGRDTDLDIDVDIDIDIDPKSVARDCRPPSAPTRWIGACTHTRRQKGNK